MLTTGAMRLAVSRGQQTWYTILGPLRLFAMHVTGSTSTRHRRGVVNYAMDTPNTALSAEISSVRPSICEAWQQIETAFWNFLGSTL